MFEEARRNSNRRPRPGTLRLLGYHRSEVTGRYQSPSAVRAARVADIARRVRAGMYTPDLTTVADRVLLDIRSAV